VTWRSATACSPEKPPSPAKSKRPVSDSHWWAVLVQAGWSIDAVHRPKTTPASGPLAGLGKGDPFFAVVAKGLMASRAGSP